MFIIITINFIYIIIKNIFKYAFWNFFLNFPYSNLSIM
nr:MAG TPA: hypothetical protein [Caudoviricetes sp.]